MSVLNVNVRGCGILEGLQAILESTAQADLNELIGALNATEKAAHDRYFGGNRVLIVPEDMRPVVEPAPAKPAAKPSKTSKRAAPRASR